ncbi:MAG TPA: ABC transporter ATP-binding protein [Desulfuromonadaceae bacterium]
MERLGTLEVKNLYKRFRSSNQELTVLDDINLTVKPGEFISVIGSSGCGKTTFLRLIVGLEKDYEGEILLDGKKLNGPDRNRGVVFQDHRLLPWLTIEKNVGLGLKNAKSDESRQTIQEHLELVGLKGFEKHYPHQLSGGMSQRAAIARALVNRPEILLLDEPLGALDALTRMYMHQELERIWNKEGITMIMITHDVEEAIVLSDKIVVMSSRPGTIKKIIPVSLARPRDRASYDFVRIKEEVLAEFHLHTEHPFSYSI